MAKNIELVRQEVAAMRNEVEDFANSAERVGGVVSDVLEYSYKESERAKGAEQDLTEAVAQNAGEIIALKGNSATKGELNAEAERAQSAEELISQQAEQNYRNFSELGVEESAKIDGYEIALTKKTNTAGKTKVKVPVYDMLNPSATPVGLVDEIFVEDMKAEAKKMVDAEAERAKAKEQELSGDLATEAERAKSAEGAIMAKALDNAGRITALEKASATKAELSAEAERATSAELLLANQLGEEEARAKAAEAALSQEIKDTVAAVIDGAPETLDTLKEVAAWIEKDESGAAAMAERIAENTGRIETLETASATKAELSAEAERAQAAEKANAEAIAAEVERAGAKEQEIEGKVTELESKVSKGLSLFREERKEQILNFVFKKGHTYCVKVEFDGVRDYAQIGTLDPNDLSKYIDSSPIKYNVQTIELTFRASDDANKFMVYAAPHTALHTIEIILLDVVEKPTFNGLLNPETTTRGYVIQPIKSLYFFVEDQYLNSDIQIGVLTYKDGKVQMHISAIGGEVLMVYEENAELRPTGMKHYKGQYGYGGKKAYIDMWFDWDLYIDEVWLSESNVKVQPFPIGGSFFNTLFRNVVITEDPAYQSLVTKEIIYEYSGLTFNRPFSSPISIKKGKKYIAEVVFDGASKMFQMGSLLDSDTYIDATPVLSNIERYTFEFEATEDSSMFIVYSDNKLNMEFKLTEQSASIIKLKSEIKDLENRLTNIVSNRSTNTVVVASFDGQENDAMVFEGWTKGTGLNNREYYGCSASETPFASAAKINKYATSYNRKIIWDIDVTNTSRVCAFTQGAELESLFAQGYCVVADFYAKTFAIHKNYGANGKGVSETLPSVLKSATFEADINQTSLFRIIMERIERTLKATLVYLKTNTVLAELQTAFEREIVPSSGLGYDMPAITSLSGNMAIYSAKLLIPNAKPCFLYIVGDSITEGVPCQQKDCWAYKVAEIVPNTIVSGRGGGNIDGVLRKIQDEASVLKPTYIMVTIGTNGGNTPEKLSQLVNDIKAIGATPIINTIYCSSTNIKASVNAEILALKEKCVRMDVATAINNNLSEGADASLFVSDGTHLNEQGNEKCYQQVLIDMPELYM